MTRRGPGADVGSGERELDGGCFVRVPLPRRVPAYGLGMPLRQMIKDPLGAGRVAEIDWA